MYSTFKMENDKLLHVALGIAAYLTWYIFPQLQGNVKCAIIVILTVELVQIEATLQKIVDLPKMLVRKDMWLDILAGLFGILIIIGIMRVI